MRSTVELRQIQYFIAAAEEEHISRAALRLHVSQPALSQRIRELEVELGVTLFDRTPRGVRLTQAGRMFLEQTRRIVADLEHARDRLRYAALGEVGRLRVAINELAGQQRLVAEAFQTFRQAFPNVALDLVQLTTLEQLSALEAGEIDVGFHHNQDQHPERLETLVLRHDTMLLGLPTFHPLAAHERIGLADLADQPLVWLDRSINPSLSDQLMAALRDKGVTPRIVLEAKSDVSMMNFISVGLGAGLVVSTRRWGDSGSVVLRHIEDLSLPVSFGLVWRQADRSALLRNFVETVRQAHQAAGRSDVEG